MMENRNQNIINMTSKELPRDDVVADEITAMWNAASRRHLHESSPAFAFDMNFNVFITIGFGFAAVSIVCRLFIASCAVNRVQFACKWNAKQ